MLYPQAIINSLYFDLIGFLSTIDMDFLKL